MNKDIKRLDLNTPDGTQLNMDALYQIAPSVFTESRDEKTGELKRVVNFDALRQLLGDNAVDENRETYEFRWVGKDAAKAEAARAIDKTLRPVVEDSVDWDTTKNLYIEGDNLEVLKLLQRSYMGKVKMIYIDPPYNTGNDYIYHDDYSQVLSEYEKHFKNEYSERYFKNSDNSGRFHSDWCNMMYSRLTVARSFLNNQGVIFISIDENEVDNLHYLCNEIFGENNFIGQFVWQCKKGGGNDSKHIAIEHEYILAVAKNKEELNSFYEQYSDEYIKRYKECDLKGKYFWDTFKRKSGKQFYPIVCPDGTILEYDDDGNKISWLRSEQRFKNDVKEGEIRIVKIGDKWSVQFKQRMPQGKKPRSIFTTNTVLSDKGTTSTGSNDVYIYFKKNVFSNPKPLELISFLLGFGVEKDDIILDFFSGSGTTADAIYRFNNQFNSLAKYILVQFPEKIEDMLLSSSENAKIAAQNAIDFLNYQGKPHLLTELGKERIRRAGKKIKEEHPLTTQDLDTGFRVFRLDDSNFNQGVQASPSDYNQQQLDLFANNIKSDRTDLDLLFGSILAWGLQLDLPMETEEVDGCKIYTVNEGDLVACFAEKVTDKVIEAMAEKEPLRVLFRDSCFDSDDKKINLFETFKQKLDWTDDEAFNNIRVI